MLPLLCVVNVLPIQTLSTSVAIGLIIPLKSNIAARTIVIDGFPPEEVLVESKLGHRQSEPVCREAKDRLEQECNPMRVAFLVRN